MAEIDACGSVMTDGGWEFRIVGLEDQSVFDAGSGIMGVGPLGNLGAHACLWAFSWDLW